MGHFDDFIFFIFLFCRFNVPFEIVYLSENTHVFRTFKKNLKKVLEIF